MKCPTCGGSGEINQTGLIKSDTQIATHQLYANVIGKRIHSLLRLVTKLDQAQNKNTAAHQALEELRAYMKRVGDGRASFELWNELNLTSARELTKVHQTLHARCRVLQKDLKLDHLIHGESASGARIWRLTELGVSILEPITVVEQGP